ncbi:MMPL family transporter [Kitasatospora sp. CM 4170]|uniref:MMPL family transporter n=1 Tax=Kitasatospora aburaviensis TaxID=67265 RepID=A0ABW1F414_9ACTN|nr:MMPL family transporter [Kitasatospora sp. CM 4170]WNM49218.1 MMPL family transporter [Kitasatospora sp. CM 4170]
MNVIARLAVARRGLILALTVFVAALAGFYGAGVQQHLANGGFQDPASESMQVDEALAGDFGTGAPNLVLIVSGRGGRALEDPEVVSAANGLVEHIRGFEGVVSADSYWSAGRPASLRAKDGNSGLVLVRLGGNEGVYQATAKRIVPQLGDDRIDLRVTGIAQTYVEVERVSADDLLRAELIVAPITLVLLVVIFGSLAAALVPLAVGGISVLSTTAVLQLLTEVTPVSVFALNVTTALGLGLAIDYSLFVISRFRDELAAGAEVAAAVRTTVRTAGLTVLFSGVTVALSLAALLVFPMYFFRSIAYGGIAVVLVAALTSVVALPALLAVLGHRVNGLDVFGRFRRRAPSGFWQRLALGVMRRPVPIVTVIVGLLLLLGSPFLSASFSLADDRVLPASSPARQAAQYLRDNYEPGETNPIPVVVKGLTGADAQRLLPGYAERLSAVPGVQRVDTLTGSYAAGGAVAPPAPAAERFTAAAGSRLSVVSTVEPYSPEGRALVAAVRSAGGAPGPVQVGGQAAQLVDTTHATGGKLPLALGLIAVMTFALLFLFTGSLLIPVKAIVLNLLSLTATFGSMVYVFQDGHLKWLVGEFITTGMIDATMPVLMFCIAFGLSMDYEVFLLSRIREEFLRGGDNTQAVALGLEKTGRVMTAGAVLIGTVFVTFASSGLTLLKLLGVGLALAVVVDATLVRGLLVPAFMRLAGRANWWAPPPLRRLHDRIGLREYADEPAGAFPQTAAPLLRRESANPPEESVGDGPATVRSAK